MNRLVFLALVILSCGPSRAVVHPPSAGDASVERELRGPAAAVLTCDDVRMEAVGRFAVATGCGRRAAYAWVGSGWRLQALESPAALEATVPRLTDDARVHERASREFGCDRAAVTFQRVLGVRVARGCGQERPYVVLCGTEVNSLEMAHLPRLASSEDRVPSDRSQEGSPAAPSPESRFTRPSRRCGRALEYTQAAKVQHTEGTASVRCVITTSGTIRSCVVFEPLPPLTEPFVEALYQARYDPVRLDGQPVNTKYTFNLLARENCE